MKFIKGCFDNEGNIVVNDNTEVELTMTEVYDDLINNLEFSVCYLTYPSNFSDEECIINSDVTKDEYLMNPVKYGLKFYKTSNKTLVFA